MLLLEHHHWRCSCSEGYRASVLRYYSLNTFLKWRLPVVFKVILNMNDNCISPVGFNGWSWNLAVESQNLTLPTIWSQSDIVDCKIILSLA